MQSGEAVSDQDQLAVPLEHHFLLFGFDGVESVACGTELHRCECQKVYHRLGRARAESVLPLGCERLKLGI